MKKNKIIPIVLILVLVFIVGGLSYAIFSSTSTSNANTISSGVVSMSFTETSSIITIDNALPMDDDTGKALTNYFDFSVTSNITINENDNNLYSNVDYDIVLEVLEVDSGYTALTNDQIKVYLINKDDGTELIGPTLIDDLADYDSNKLLYSNTHTHYSTTTNNTITTNYRLIAWIDEDVDASSWTSSTNYEYKFRININGDASSLEERPACFVKGTKITMADGTLKNIEDIEVGDSVLAFDHETGTYMSRNVYIAFKGDDLRDAFTLHFENGEELSIVDVHDLFDKDENKYVRINENNAESFIGHYFYNATENKYVELVSITRDIKDAEYYSIYSEYSLNTIANNMLSVPDDVDFYLNIYEFDSNLKADSEALARDIETYGYFDYSEYDFELDYIKYIAKYVRIILGKNLATKEELFNYSWINYTSELDK